MNAHGAAILWFFGTLIALLPGLWEPLFWFLLGLLFLGALAVLVYLISEL